MQTTTKITTGSRKPNSCHENEKLYKDRILVIRMEKKILDFTVIIEEDEDGWYVATVPEIQGCYTQGKTINKILERIKEAIELCLEADKEEIEPMKFIGIQRVQVKKPIIQ